VLLSSNLAVLLILGQSVPIFSMDPRSVSYPDAPRLQDYFANFGAFWSSERPRGNHGNQRPIEISLYV
jgi:hypothetical protein